MLLQPAGATLVCPTLVEQTLFCFGPAAVILGGGAGTRLYPLTKNRAKPAVPIGGAYRLVRAGGDGGTTGRHTGTQTAQAGQAAWFESVECAFAKAAAVAATLHEHALGSRSHAQPGHGLCELRGGGAS